MFKMELRYGWGMVMALKGVERVAVSGVEREVESDDAESGRIEAAGQSRGRLHLL